MSLDIQIKSLVFSFLYGIVFAAFFKLNYRYLYFEKLIIRLIISILFSLDMSILYFIILKEINYGVIHPYFIGMIILGFILTNYFCKHKLINRK